MSGEELAVLIGVFAFFTAPCFTTEELNILAAVLTQLADTYSTISELRSNNTQNDGDLDDLSDKDVTDAETLNSKI